MSEVVERIAFLARGDKRVDQRSGVSQRLPITVLEQVVSNAEQRALIHREKKAVPRISDIFAAQPAVTGKLELEYEGELQGGERVASTLIQGAIGDTLAMRSGESDFEEVVNWFDEGGALKVSPNERAEVCLKGYGIVPGLLDTVNELNLAPRKDPATLVSACELALEGLVAQKQISRNDAFSYSRIRRERPDGHHGSGGTLMI